MKNRKTTITAIICELNPMHNGHVYIASQAKQLTNADFVVGVLSGNFSQRSEPCLLDKYTRAKIACENGFDLMINLPTAFCTNNAEIFALSAIKILNNLKTISYLAFGVETLNEQAFYSLAKFMQNEPETFKQNLKQNLDSGLSFNNAYILAIKQNPQYFEKNLFNDIKNILSKANNILALEYVKALIKTNSKIKPIFVHRKSDYNNPNIEENFASATSLRNKIFENKLFEIEKFLPKNSVKYFKKNKEIYQSLFDNFSSNFDDKILQKNKVQIDQNLTTNFCTNFIIPSKLQTLILYKIKTANKEDLKSIYAISEGFENNLKYQAQNTNSFDLFYKSLQTKRFKQNRINSILLNILLNIDKNTIQKLYTIKNNIFVKILAINPQKRNILGKINTKNLILRKTDASTKRFDGFNKKLFEIENNANSVYNLIFNTSLCENDLYNKMQN